MSDKVNRWLERRGRYADEIAEIRDRPAEPDGLTPPGSRHARRSWPGAAFVAGMAVLLLVGVVASVAYVWSTIEAAAPMNAYSGGYGAHAVAAVHVPASTPPAPTTAFAADHGYRAVDIAPAAAFAQQLGGASIPTEFQEMAVAAADARMIAHEADGQLRLQPVNHGGAAPAAAVADGVAYVSGGWSSHELYAVDVATGAVRWAVRLSDNGPGRVSVDGDTAVVNTESCTLYALDAETGRPRWSHYVSDPVISRPGIGEGVVVTTYPIHAFRGGVPIDGEPPLRPTHVVAGFDAATGGLARARWVDGDSIGAPEIHQGRVYFATFAGSRYALDARTGGLEWAVRDGATSRPVVCDGRLLFTARIDGGREGVVVSPLDDPARARVLHASVSSGHVSASRALGSHGDVMAQQMFEGSRLVVGPRHVAAVLGRDVVCFDRAAIGATAAPAWTRRLDNGGRRWRAAAPAVDAGRVVVGTARGELLTLDADSGDVLGARAILDDPSAASSGSFGHHGHTDTGRITGVSLHEDRAVVALASGGVEIVPLPAGRAGMGHGLH